MRLIMHSSVLISVVLQLLLTSIRPTVSADTPAVTPLAPHEISYLVLSQSPAFFAQRAQAVKQSILEQQSKLAKFNDQLANTGKAAVSGNVHLSHEIFVDQEGSWAITPILKHIRSSILKVSHAGTRWLIICEENSHVNVSLLSHHLGQEDYHQELFLGYPLYDREATIIHHFAFFKNPSSFLYPYLRAGVALTIPLVDRLIQVLSSAGSTLTEFFIDAGHEFALLVWNRGTGSPLTPASYFCARPGEKCAIYAESMDKGSAETCLPVAKDAAHILFAVKTCEKFHEERVPVLLHTWAQYVEHLRLYSDISDATIPTIETSIPNTSSGHCAKTLEILHLISEEISRNSSLTDVRWIMLVDDDTILSPSALTRHLSCFNPAQHVYLGERYGYHLLGRDGDGSAEDGYGYNYITGGGGIVISVKIIDALLQSCECPSASSPDDMIVAACLYRLGVRPIHSTLFHQARPSDYPPETLDAGSISFHKHWQIDPYHVYNRWFRQNDEVWHQQSVNQEPKYAALRPHEDNDSQTSKHGKPLLQPKHISNDNDSTRQEYNRSPHGIATVASRKDELNQLPSAGQLPETRPVENDNRRYQNENVVNSFCENNELQSNSNLLLSRHHQSSGSLQEPNIIKHTEL
ncbi:beta-1,3-glucosyltransferase [Topomyia yanbarensis]|uniref:beta-1,3-glucosyltransferase n=1 Tax=Topomyia yanbarensis TaxID=2498891 RepID=UPI00273B2704|nr:beta-1,3-glucosyltransferase [Topomyia yanbarensis]XP_058814517.1 beta-1,3-glucosyltransferase [Topomyia yanbarensis]XP_058814518.1 beta-1,3-glucosyltransferase [Topomyia yanbarensis]XP_058814519.1 beta-1,3-glucosyltransferase [Topomyia yanbarensis]XP_058814520.1 beta-1,3-glucosyltransferase [Topomyia yanbarensis]XP_058814521.1 beta-1,3-glucosyltransferase [Topomyia yanbarensis]XP_058814522.1 beta-1,3-glucosyltransferase [Topomyia yanbarensis]XP_058814523.1 beta-1,3-glucosyltransferase [T